MHVFDLVLNSSEQSLLAIIVIFVFEVLTLSTSSILQFTVLYAKTC